MVPVVRLMRRVHHFVPRINDPYEENQGMELIPSNGHPGAMFVPGTAAIGESTDLKTVSHEASIAVWWTPAKDVSQGTFLRHLEGEIHLSADLQPSCACEIFRVEASWFFIEHIKKNSVADFCITCSMLWNCFPFDPLTSSSSRTSTPLDPMEKLVHGKVALPRSLLRSRLFADGMNQFQLHIVNLRRSGCGVFSR